MLEMKKNETKLEIPLGVGYTPPNHALWHLLATKVIENLSDFRSPAWEKANASNDPVRVALLDTPVAVDHPNLKGAIDLGLMRDFAVRDEGAFPFGPEVDAESRKEIEDWAEKNSDSALGNSILEEKSKAVGPTAVLDAHNAHGTCMAGLIGGRPSTCDLLSPFLSSENGPEDNVKSGPSRVKLPFCGINPFCRIVPISIPTAPTMQTILNALEYAKATNCKVITIASSWQNPNLEYQWTEVEDKLYELSESGIFILCAAGNEEDASDVFPAKLSTLDKYRNLYAITACDEDGQLLSYAPKLNSKFLKCLSAEEYRYDREVESISPWEYVDPLITLPRTEPPTAYHYKEIVSTDVPGPYGYSPSIFKYNPSENNVHLEISSLYSSFSGTSAATAIATGLISLAMMIGRGNHNSQPSEMFDLNKAIDLVKSS